MAAEARALADGAAPDVKLSYLKIADVGCGSRMRSNAEIAKTSVHPSGGRECLVFPIAVISGNR